MGEFSLTHLVIIAVVFLIFFRKDQLPSMGKSIGKAIRGFKEGISEIEVEAKDIHDDKTTNSKSSSQLGHNQNAANELKSEGPAKENAVPLPDDSSHSNKKS